MQIIIGEEIRQRCPEFKGIAVLASVRNTAFDEALWAEIDHFIDEYRNTYTTDSIKQMPSIEATREAYKRCGEGASR